MDPTALAIAGILAQFGVRCFQGSALYLDGQSAWAEWAAWGFIALFFRLRLFFPSARDALINDKEAQTAPKRSRPRIEASSMLLAFLMVAAKVFEIHHATEKLQWSLPLITMVAFLLADFGRPTNIACGSCRRTLLQLWHEVLPRLINRRSEAGIPAPLFLSISLASCFALMPQATTLNQTNLLIGMLFVCWTAATYTLITRISSTSESEITTNRSLASIEEVIKPTSIRAFALCTLYLAFFSPGVTKIRFLVLAISILRCLELCAIISLCHGNAGAAASTLATASVAIFEFILSKEVSSTYMYGLVTIASLMQACNSLPKSAISRAWVFVLLLLPCTSLLSTSLGWAGPKSRVGEYSLTRSHPIQQLVDAGERQFETMLARQSNTVREAVAEYQRRYGRSPPTGYDRWFKIAQSKGFLLIDEFDTIMASLEPYWGVSPSVLRARLKSIEGAEDLIKFEIRGDQVTYSSDHYHASYMMGWINQTTWSDVIPDLSFMISTLDEPRVVAPYDTLTLAIKRAKGQRRLHRTVLAPVASQHPAGGSNEVKWISVGKQDAWEAMLSSCSVDSPARSEAATNGIDLLHRGLPFVQNMTANKDICASSDLLHGHGFLASPASLTVTHSLVPIFAQCKPSIFNDVLYPSPFYQMQMQSMDYNASTDTAFLEKLDRVYWAGTNTGGFSNIKNWMTMHRQRLAIMTAPESTTSVSLLQRDLVTGVWKCVQSTWSRISHLFHLRITAIIQCADEACKAMHEQFKSLEHEPKEAALESKYALDIDGNTFSGRYYRLLKSNVCVLKHTSFNEWHDGRLVPWVHFIPVSAGAEELGEMVRYLTQEDEGRAIGEKIADQGRDWARKTLREEDLEIAFVRVLMEYARIISDGRESMTFEIET